MPLIDCVRIESFLFGGTVDTSDHAPRPRLSLVIATLGSVEPLRLCLESLQKQHDAPAFEVLIVDQNGDERLNPVVAAFTPHLRIIHERVGFRGASRARNHGVSVAQADWVGFPDDDCQLHPDALASVARLVATGAYGVITGQTVDDRGVPNVLRWRSSYVDFDRWSMFGCLTEATLFVRRDAFDAVGGFDERFGPGARFPAAEGVELMNRLFGVLDDKPARYDPAIKMAHPTKIPPWNRWAVARFYQYAIGDGALIAKSPQPHILYWGARTVGSALREIITFNGWKSAAFAARVLGLAMGFLAFNVRRFQ